VPADVRLVTCIGFSTEEAILTGESVPVAKHTTVVTLPPPPLPGAAAPSCPVGDRKNMAFFGCLVVRGRATGVVTGVGMGTELGKIAKTIG
jgi:magnesium-transporting ATPase (P-type)